MDEKKDWFQPHFEPKDEGWEDPRFPGIKRAQAGPPGSNRRNSSEDSNLIIADPNILDLHLSYSTEI